jgi:hypothetical protein
MAAEARRRRPGRCHWLAARPARGDENGVAMLIAVLFMLVMVMVPIAMMTANLGQLPLSRYDIDRQAALAAADSGVQDYINRLNHNPDYWVYNATNPPPDGNQALANPPVWVPVSSQSPTSFHYSVNTAMLGSQGILLLTVWGRSRNVVREIQVGLRPVGFLDNLSLSNFNLVDPDVLPPAYLWQNSVAATQAACVWDYWEARPASGAYGVPAGTGPDMADCQNLINYWITGNTINGPIRSNDDYYLNGTPQFDGAVVTGDPKASDSPYWVDPAGAPPGGDHPVFEQPYSTTPYQPIQGSGTITFPPSDSSIQSYATVGTAGDGCLYTGPTAITLNGTTMTVDSPMTKSTNTVPGGASCVGTNIPLPANGVIYVQNVPASSSDPNYSASCPSGFNPSSWDGAAGYGTGDNCKSGDVFVQGTLNGQLTVAAANDIFITGDITYNNFTGNTVLGLVTNNFVLIDHPVNGSGNTVVGTETFDPARSAPIPKFTVPASYGSSTCPGSTSSNYATSNPPQCTLTVDAAILSVNHSLGTANFQTGGVLGNLNIDGAISGQFMDIEGVFSGANLADGYNENYTYDTRLERLTPPYFLDPSQTTWKQISYEECNLNTGC